MKDNRKYLNGGVNADDDFEMVEPNQLVNAENFRVGSTDTGATKRGESIGGTDLIFDALPPTGTNYCIGGCSDDSRNRIFWFNYNSSGSHGIYCYDKTAGTTYTVLLEADVTGGLGFSKDYYIHSCFFVNNCLYWVNSTWKQPRRINVERGIKAHHSTYVTSLIAYTLPVAESIIMWIRRPGGLPPMQQKQTQTFPARLNNYIKDDAFQFCYRYTYIDYEQSVLSPYSDLAAHNTNTETYNRIDVTIPLFETITADVAIIDLIVRLVDTDTFYVIKTWDINNTADLSEIENHNAGTNALTFKFYNDAKSEVIDETVKVKPYDSIPLFAETTASARNRNFMGNIVEGYDTPLTTSLTVDYKFDTITTAPVTEVIGDWYRFQIGLGTYPGQFVRHLVRLSFAINNITVPPNTVYYYETNLTPGTPPPFPSALFDTDLTYVGSNILEITRYYQGLSLIPTPLVVPPGMFLNTVSLSITIGITASSSAANFLSKVFKTQGTYALGLTFYDYYQRKCGIVPMTNGGVFYNPILTDRTATVTATATNTLTVDLTFFAILVGDRIQLPTSAIAGTYTVVSVSYVGSIYTIVTKEPIGTLASTSIQIGVLRPEIGPEIINIPNGLINNKYVKYLNWNLTSSINEIPDWAHYYSINITKCLTTRTFFQSYGLAMYITRDVNGLYVYGANSNWSPFKAGIAIDANVLQFFSIGYAFQQGDVCRIIVGGIEFSLKVIDTDGKYLILENFNVGYLQPTQVVYEIFSPYKRQDAKELYFEVGQMFPIYDPGTVNRVYSVESGVIGGDVFLLKRGDLANDPIIMEAMNPNDKFFANWNTDAGRPNVIERIGQAERANSFCFSDVYIGNTKVNGLSSFSALNSENVPVENGAIRKLQLAQKVAEKGTILLAICEVETCSIYLGETQLEDNSGKTFLVKSVGLIGNLYALKGSKGTKDPESVFEYNGLVCFWDRRNGAAIQYSDNGLDSLSQNRLSRVSNLFSKKYDSLTTAEIEALGSRPFIIGGVDPHHKEFLFSIPSTEATPPKGYLEDYDNPKIIYPYDIYDGRGKTLIYKSKLDFWSGSMTIQVEKFIRMGNDLYGFDKGKLYKFNSANHANFFGTQHPVRIMFPNNDIPGTVKRNLSIGLDSNIKPTFVHFRTERPYVQSSDLLLRHFKEVEGVLYAGLRRDRLSPNTPGDVYDKWLSGDRMFGKCLLTMLEFDVSEQNLELLFTHIGYDINKGHLILKS